MINFGIYRRGSSHKPWQTNNQQQKYNGTGNSVSASPTPSQSAAMKNRGANASSGGESDTHDKHMHDRTLYLLMNLVVSIFSMLNSLWSSWRLLAMESWNLLYI